MLDISLHLCCPVWEKNVHSYSFFLRRRQFRPIYFVSHDSLNLFLSFYKAPQKGLQGSLTELWQLATLYQLLYSHVNSTGFLSCNAHCYYEFRAPHSASTATTVLICCSLRWFLLNFCLHLCNSPLFMMWISLSSIHAALLVWTISVSIA